VGDTPYKGSVPGGGYKSISGKMRTSKGQLPARAPGIGADGINYQGRIKGQRPLKGGGSVSGRSWNNKGRALAGRAPGKGADQIGTFSGNIKGQKPLKGGGSVSGQSWNNKGRAVAGRAPGKGADKIGTYSGNIKGRRPLKGGGSVSGQMWNNKGQPVSVRTPSSAAAKAGTYQGNIKGRRPLKGGGSVSGQMWNNRQTPLPVRTPPAQAKKAAGYPGGYKMFDLKPSMRNQGEEFTGTMKAKRQVKGAGGSVSGQLWNNKEQPLPVRTPTGKASRDIEGFPGKHHQFEYHPSMRDQGEEFTGTKRLPRFKKQYIKNPNAADEALKKNRPGKSTYKVEGLQVKIKEKDYKTRPNAAEGSMPGIAPGKGSIKASEYARGLKLKWNYKHNPSSADEAQDVREPGKAFARVTDYQGNIKMKSFKIFRNKELHPDAQFVKTNKNNTDEEKDMLTNFKLWWARVFKKSDTQPDHLKEKIRKPRYDKGEQGLWYD
jgi:hypothetical protein